MGLLTSAPLLPDRGGTSELPTHAGFKSQQTFRELYFHLEVTNVGMWNHTPVINIWHIVASQGPVLKLFPCLGKENCLRIGLSQWGMNRVIGSSLWWVFKLWSTQSAVAGMAFPG